MTYDLVSHFTPRENGEWTHPYSYEEHLQMLSDAGKRVRRKRLVGKFALMMIVVGFALQIFGQWFDHLVELA